MKISEYLSSCDTVFRSDLVSVQRQLMIEKIYWRYRFFGITTVMTGDRRPIAAAIG